MSSKLRRNKQARNTMLASAQNTVLIHNAYVSMSKQPGSDLGRIKHSYKELNELSLLRMQALTLQRMVYELRQENLELSAQLPPISDETNDTTSAEDGSDMGESSEGGNDETVHATAGSESSEGAQ